MFMVCPPTAVELVSSGDGTEALMPKLDIFNGGDFGLTTRKGAGVVDPPPPAATADAASSDMTLFGERKKRDAVVPSVQDGAISWTEGLSTPSPVEP